MPQQSIRFRNSIHLTAGIALAVAAGLVLSVSGADRAHAAIAVPLGNAASFAVLAGSTVTNSGPTVINGDVGVFPGSALPGLGASNLAGGGSIYAADVVAQSAQTDLTAAITQATTDPAQLPNVAAPNDLSGSSLTAGVYVPTTGTSFSNTGVLTLTGTASDIFLFKMGGAGTLITAVGSSMVLTGGVSPCNVFWQVGSSATIGGGSTLAGTVMADQSINVGTGAVIEGRLLTRIGQVSLLGNTITSTGCAAPRPAAAGGLADTGAEPLVPLIAGGVALAVGWVMLVAARRRRTTTARYLP